MAKKISLREFQESVTAKLNSLSTMTSTSSKLGVRTGSQLWLIDLADVSEVIPVPALTDVPLTRPWFSGVANIRGNLYSAIDFSSFMGSESTPINMESRLLLVHQKYSLNAGLIVNKMMGLRNPDLLQRKESHDVRHPWIAGEYTDTDGNHWRDLRMQELIHHPDFLQVGMV